jgi:hypothetical protein
MKKKIILIVLAVVALVGILVAVDVLTRTGPRDMTLDLSGTPGMVVSGKYSADGASHEFSGVLPTNIVVKARHFKFTIKKLADNGDIQGKLFVDGKDVAMSGTTAPYGGVTGEAKRYASALRSVSMSGASTVSKDEK